MTRISGGGGVIHTNSSTKRLFVWLAVRPATSSRGTFHEAFELDARVETFPAADLWNGASDEAQGGGGGLEERGGAGT